jgi:hypothetical protein
MGTRVGMHAPPVTVEVHFANGLPMCNLVGLPETEVRESKDRVRAALVDDAAVGDHHQPVGARASTARWTVPPENVAMFPMDQRRCRATGWGSPRPRATGWS